MTAAILLMAAAWQEPRVTFECPAGRVENVFPELSKAAGVPLRFSAQTKDEVLILCVKDVPLDELRAKIAEAASAEWQAEEGGFRLIRSAGLLRKLEDGHRRQVTEILRASQEVLRKQLEGQPEYSEVAAQGAADRLLTYFREKKQSGNYDYDYRRMEAMQPSFPGWRLAARIAASLDPEVLASIPLRHNLVFSSSPNVMQRPLPKAAMAAIDTYAIEAARFAKHLPAQMEWGEMGWETNTMQALQLGQRENHRPSKVLAIVRSPAESGLPLVRVLIADAEGKAAGESNLSLVPYDRATAAAASIPPGPTANETPIEPRSLSIELAEKAGQLNRAPRGEVPAISPELRAFLLNPERNEIASLTVSDLAIGAAKAKGLNLVMSPSFMVSTSWSAIGIRSGDPSSWTPTNILNGLRQTVFGLSGSTGEAAEGWYVLRPKNWVIDRHNWPDRSAHGAFMRAAARKIPGIEELAALALKCPTDRAFGSARRYVALIAPPSPDRNESTSFDLLRLHGSLNASQRNLAAKEGLPLNGFTPFQRSLIDFLVFGSGYGLSMTLDSSAEGNSELMDWETLMGGLKSEPTELYAQGLPQNTILRILDGNESIIRANFRREGGVAGYSEMGDDFLARVLLAGERPELAEFITGGQHLEQFTWIHRQQFRYRLLTLPKIAHIGQLRSTLSASTPVKSPLELPTEVIQRIQPILAKLREQYRNFKPPRG